MELHCQMYVNKGDFRHTGPNWFEQEYFPSGCILVCCLGLGRQCNQVLVGYGQAIRVWSYSKTSINEYFRDWKKIIILARIIYFGLRYLHSGNAVYFAGFLPRFILLLSSSFQKFSLKPVKKQLSQNLSLEVVCYRS